MAQTQSAGRILLVSQTVPLPARRRTWQQACALRDDGWEVWALCQRQGDEPAFEFVESIGICRYPGSKEGAGRLSIILEYLWAWIVISIYVFRLQAKRRFDVVQVTSPPDWLVIAVWPLKVFRTKIVIDIADLCPELYAAKFGKRGVLHSLVLAVSMLAYRISDGAIVANTLMQRIARRRGADPAIVCHSYAAPLTPGERNRTEGSTVIGWFGVVGAQDGVQTLIEAFHKLPKPHNSELHIVGDGPAFARSKELATALGTNRIIFKGFLTGPALEQSLREFDIGVIPDPQNCYTRTITTNKAFTYLALGLPVVATPLWGNKYVLGETAIYAKGDEADAIAIALSECLLAVDKGELKISVDRDEIAAKWSAETALYLGTMKELVAK